MMNREGILVLALDRARRCIYEMLDFIVPATFQDIEEAYHIAVNISVWVF